LSECEHGGWGSTDTHNEKVSVSSSSSSATAGPKLPPWLSQYHQISTEQVTEQIQWLEFTLMEQGFLVADISQIVSPLTKVSQCDAVLAAGMVDFLRMLLGLRQDECGAVFVTTPVLLASIIHYADCVAVRRKGVVPDTLRKVMLDQIASSASMKSSNMLPGVDRVMNTTSTVLARKEEPPLGSTQDPITTTTMSSANPYEAEVRLICKGAARVKRAECLAHAVLQHRVVTDSQAARLRNLYLMSMEQDWRSLALRVVACLYRLEGLLRMQSSDYTEKTQQMVQVAREALRIYAPLAQRLGMHRLKAMIEERAFRLQYRRQYRAVSSLYHETGEVMQSVSTYLQSNIQQILAGDEALVDQLQSLQVVTRVKEPYSFWRKLLNQKARGLLMPSSRDEEGSNLQDRERRSLSVTQVNDAVALRVILQARKLDPNEPDDVTRARERMLCYYVQHLIRGKWPETDTERIKDYIRNPKPNGYRSLHHTSQIASRGIKFPFEVQVRSAEMHVCFYVSTRKVRDVFVTAYD
jgi:ppGpp synthetase/RelA/SpoT-type nucleotidyltranferase